MEREEIDIAIGELETRLDRLRALYEHYFMGIERTEPAVARKDVERRVAELRKARFQSTAQRFKFQTIVQRYNTMQQHWSRTCREIELGTYRRHKLKAEKAFGDGGAAVAATMAVAVAAPSVAPSPVVRTARARRQAEQDLRALLTASAEVSLAGAADGFDSVEPGTVVAPGTVTDAPRGQTGSLLSRLRSDAGPSLSGGLAGSLPPRVPQAKSLLVAPSAARKPPPPVRPPARVPEPAAAPPQPLPGVPPASALTEDRLRQLHSKYVDARAKTNATTVSFEKLERSIRETESKLRAAHGGRQVDFEVVVQDGKAILKPRLT